jgi:beta-barrel assembly-enhancing protease
MRLWMLSLLLTAAAYADMSVEQEVALGREAAQQVEAQVTIDRSPELNAKLQRLAEKLVPVAGRNDLEWRFKVIQSEEFNAMALPGGFVYATSKVVRDLPDGQLAFVLGHELSHITQRHSIHQMEGDQMRRLGLMAILLGLGRGRLSQQAAGLAQLVDQVISSRYSQADEDDADRRGLEMMARAGVDPAWGLLALQTISRLTNRSMPQFVNAMVGSHPLPRERVQSAIHFIPSVPFAGVPVSHRNHDDVQRWERELQAAVTDGSGLRPDATLAVAVRRELDTMQLSNTGVLLMSPAEETYGQLERRLLSQEVSWLAARRGEHRGFGLALRTMSTGEKLVWMRVR